MSGTMANPKMGELEEGWWREQKVVAGCYSKTTDGKRKVAKGKGSRRTEERPARDERILLMSEGPDRKE